jgi:hypothetical protein
MAALAVPTMKSRRVIRRAERLIETMTNSLGKSRPDAIAEPSKRHRIFTLYDDTTPRPILKIASWHVS